MRPVQGAIILLLLSSLLFGVAQANPGEGELLLFLAGTEAGGETYLFSETELTTEGTISIGGQSLAITTSLEGNSKQWTTYQAQLMPGASYSATFTENSMVVDVGPLQRSFSLQAPYVVLDNNVFAHYEQVLGLLAPDQEQMMLQIVVPVLVLANQHPVLTGELSRVGQEYYQLGNDPILVDEFVLTMPGNLQIRLLGQQGRLLRIEIPMQGVEVVRTGYLELKPLESEEEVALHFTTEDFVVDNGAISLAGTLSLPLGEGPFPAILLNSGTGPQDRQGNTPPVYMTNMFSLMAEKLTERGIAVLAYDERGVGESTGDYDAATLDDLLSDIEVLLDFLAKHPQLDNSRLAMLGHSEGAYFAPIFADKLSALVLLAGASIPLDELMVEQVDYQLEQPWLSPQEATLLSEARQQVDMVLEEAREGKEVSEVWPMNLEWLRQHMALDPLENLAKVESPVLIVHGEQDLKVMPYHAEELAEALRNAGNDRVEVHHLLGTTHEFLFFPYDNEEFDPLDPMRLNPQLFEIVADWLAKKL